MDYKIKIEGEGTEYSLPSPQFGNKDEYNFPTAVNESRGGSVLKGRASFWTEERKATYEIADMRKTQAEDILKVLEDSLGKAVIIRDQDGICWRGYILNPESAVAEEREDRFKVKLEIELSGRVTCSSHFS